MTIKSPFLILEHFISPMECENIISSVSVDVPNSTEDGTPLKTIIRAPLTQIRMWERLSEYFEDIENYYNVEVDSVTPIDIEWYPESAAEEIPRCENSQYTSGKWRLRNDKDFTFVVFLKDFNDNHDFDDDFECYGGQLEITNHNFSFNPKRGTGILFPSNQYFINRTQSPKFGDAFQMRMHLICSERFAYNPLNFRGNHQTWFKNLTV